MIGGPSSKVTQTKQQGSQRSTFDMTSRSWSRLSSPSEVFDRHSYTALSWTLECVGKAWTDSLIDTLARSSTLTWLCSRSSKMCRAGTSPKVSQTCGLCPQLKTNLWVITIFLCNPLWFVIALLSSLRLKYFTRRACPVSLAFVRLVIMDLSLLCHTQKARSNQAFCRRP